MESAVRTFLAGWGPDVVPTAGDVQPPDFVAQCEALLAAAPRVVSSVMGLHPPGFVSRMKVAAALLLGAAAVQIGTGFLRCPEAEIPSVWADAIGAARPEGTLVTRAISGRAGRSIATAYARAAAGPGAPRPAPYPVQRGFTQAMRDLGTRTNDIERIQAWAGQAAGMACAAPAAEIVADLWEGAHELLR